MKYVKLNHSEKIFGEKDLLNSQVDILNLVKKIQNYRHLRNQELAAKILLRKKIAEILDELKILDKTLPKPKELGNKEGKMKRRTGKERRQDLESEIEEIRRKIERLQ